MALDIVITSDRLQTDPGSRALIEYLRDHEAALGIEAGVLWYDFPVFSDYDTVSHRPDVLVFSPRHGFVVVRFADEGLFARSPESILEVDQSLSDFSSNLYSRLLRSRELRKTRSQIIVDVHPVIFVRREVSNELAQEVDSFVCHSFDGVADVFAAVATEPIDADLAAEVRSVVEGAKALTRPQKRVVQDANRQPLAVALGRLEAEIANFDQKQRRVALVEVGGPARIRGLAGSGKTVILAMKAAHIHLTHPEQRILTESSASLRRPSKGRLRSSLRCRISKKSRRSSAISVRNKPKPRPLGKS
jgi:superfamily I DNA and RNA helicase